MTSWLALTWTVHPLVVVRVDAHVLLLGAEGKLAALKRFELVVRLQVRPAPHAAVDDMRQPFTMRHLQSSVQRAWDGHAAAGLAGAAERAFQLLHGALLLLQLLDESVHSLLCPLLLLVALLPAQEALHRRAGEGKQRRDVHPVRANTHRTARFLTGFLLFIFHGRRMSERLLANT